MREIKQYPHRATASRAHQIRERFTQITSGMTPDEVASILGEADEIRPLYEPRVKSGKLIGSTYWYVIRRSRPTGDNQEALVRISFGLDRRVFNVDSWGLELTP